MYTATQTCDTLPRTHEMLLKVCVTHLSVRNGYELRPLGFLLKAAISASAWVVCGGGQKLREGKSLATDRWREPPSVAILSDMIASQPPHLVDSLIVELFLVIR